MSGQAILTRYLPPTNTKPSRIAASCERGRIVVSYDSAESQESAHRLAVQQLVQRFATEDFNTYGTKPEENPWKRPFVSGGLPNGDWAHVFLTTEGNRRLSRNEALGIAAAIRRRPLCEGPDLEPENAK